MFYESYMKYIVIIQLCSYRIILPLNVLSIEEVKLRDVKHKLRVNGML
jgi:hypothetical protein